MFAYNIQYDCTIQYLTYGCVTDLCIYSCTSFKCDVVEKLDCSYCLSVHMGVLNESTIQLLSWKVDNI